MGPVERQQARHRGLAVRYLLPMGPIPAQVSALLQDLSGALPTLLGENLSGVYIYGSLTQGAFNSQHSDIDCIVLTERELTDTQFAQLDAWFTRAGVENPWVARLQISLMIRDEILTTTPRGNCLYQFGRLSRVGSEQSDHMDQRSGERGRAPRPTAELVRPTDHIRDSLCGTRP
jgi:predicted nucleotidyltransferase